MKPDGNRGVLGGCAGAPVPCATLGVEAEWGCSRLWGLLDPLGGMEAPPAAFSALGAGLTSLSCMGLQSSLLTLCLPMDALLPQSLAWLLPCTCTLSGLKGKISGQPSMRWAPLAEGHWVLPRGSPKLLSFFPLQANGILGTMALITPTSVVRILVGLLLGNRK